MKSVPFANLNDLIKLVIRDIPQERLRVALEALDAASFSLKSGPDEAKEVLDSNPDLKSLLDAVRPLISSEVAVASFIQSVRSNLQPQDPAVLSSSTSGQQSIPQQVRRTGQEAEAWSLILDQKS